MASSIGVRGLRCVCTLLVPPQKFFWYRAVMEDDDLADELCNAIDRYMKRHPDVLIGEIFDAYDVIRELLAAEKIQLHRTH